MPAIPAIATNLAPEVSSQSGETGAVETGEGWGAVELIIFRGKLGGSEGHPKGMSICANLDRCRAQLMEAESKATSPPSHRFHDASMLLPEQFPTSGCHRHGASRFLSRACGRHVARHVTVLPSPQARVRARDHAAYRRGISTTKLTYWTVQHSNAPRALAAERGMWRKCIRRFRVLAQGRFIRRPARRRPRPEEAVP
jgi:hypothetical protein